VVGAPDVSERAVFLAAHQVAGPVTCGNPLHRYGLATNRSAVACRRGVAAAEAGAAMYSSPVTPSGRCLRSASSTYAWVPGTGGRSPRVRVARPGRDGDGCSVGNRNGCAGRHRRFPGTVGQVGRQGSPPLMTVRSEVQSPIVGSRRNSRSIDGTKWTVVTVVPLDEVGEPGGVAVGVRWGDHEGGAGVSVPRIPDGYIEAGGCLVAGLGRRP